ncbi:hypothetical protein BG22_09785 [Bifidobacterium sp. UTBIF-78]|nr:hypothetical protein BG22_09785 [Bifidobacterium sp. UTBIF-78]
MMSANSSSGASISPRTHCSSTVQIAPAQNRLALRGADFADQRTAVHVLLDCVDDAAAVSGLKQQPVLRHDAADLAEQRICDYCARICEPYLNQADSAS